MRSATQIAATAVAMIAFGAAGCERDTSGLEPAPLSTDPIVFLDNFPAGVDYQAFLGSIVGVISVDANEKYAGTGALRIQIPYPGDPDGGWAGGAFVTNEVRDFSGYDALTFWAKSSKESTLDVAGLGNDNTGTSQYEAKWSRIALTTTWTRYAIPIPLPARLDSERGLFFFAEGPEGGEGHVVWFDEIQFEKTGTIANPRPAMTTQTVNAFVGATVSAAGTTTTFDVDGTDQVIEHMPGYFTFISSADSVATCTDGAIHVVGAGSATITAKLGEVDATGTLTLNATASPTIPAPVPTLPASDVISLFSNRYANVTVDTWSAGWDRADVTDLAISGDDVKAYTNLVYAGIEFTSAVIDATAMTHFHVHVWVPAGTVFRVKLVDFGADGTYGGGNDSECELSFTASSTPPLAVGTWVGLDIPLASFVTLTGRAHLAQLIVSGDMNTAYVDNIYFHR